MTDGLPNFFVTGLAKALVGEQPCRLEPWLKARKLMPKGPTSESMLRWKAEHTEQLQREAERFRAEGWKTSVERFIRVTGQTAIISGKPDIIAQQDGKRPKVVDIKSGDPKDYYAAQVAIYMVLLPLAWERPGWIFDGEIVYASGERVKVSPEQAHDLKPKAFLLVRQLAGDRPMASPSETSCRFCDATVALCPDRIVADLPLTMTSEF